MVIFVDVDACSGDVTVSSDEAVDGGEAETLLTTEDMMPVSTGYAR